MFRREWRKPVVILALALALLIVSLALPVHSALADDVGEWSNPYIVMTFADEDGRELNVIIVPGRPPEIKAAIAIIPEADGTKATNSLSNVPAFDWSYGCSATSAAMLFGYYDRTGYADMYTGPTNGGVCPLDNAIWGPGIGGSDGECPLSATHNGIDGRTIRGHVDDYWVDCLSAEPDPFIGNWPEHTHGDCTGDFMGTNQSEYSNVDGSTMFASYKNGDPTYDLDDSVFEPYHRRDGCHGMRLFAESRGYTVVTNYNQLIRGQGTDPSLGFTFNDYMVEIDAGRPVLIHIEGHTMLGFGYNTSGNVVYLYDTWDHSSHSMTWGGKYEGMYQHDMVTVIELEPPPAAPSVTTNYYTSLGASDGQPTATLNGMITNDGGKSCEYQFQYGTSPSAYTEEPGWTGSKTTGESFSETISGLEQETKYYFRAQARNIAGTGSGGELSFTTPKLFSVTLGTSPDAVSLTVDGTNYSSDDLPKSFSWVDGSQHNCVAPSPVGSGEEGTRYAFTSWSPDGDISPSKTITVSGNATYTANYDTQHYLTVESDYGEPSGEGWYDKGSDINIETTEIIGDDDTRYIFLNWVVDGDDETDNSISITMDAPHTAVTAYKTQHYLTVESDYGDPEGEDWYDEGTSAEIETDDIITDDDTRYVFLNWVVDGDDETDNPASVTIDAPYTAATDYKTQHYLTVNSDYGDPEGENWYDDGNMATASVTSPVGTIVRKVFSGWSGDLTATASTKIIVMDGPKTVTANWRDDYLYLYLIIGGIVVVVGGGAALVLSSRRSRKPGIYGGTF